MHLPIIWLICLLIQLPMTVPMTPSAALPSPMTHRLSRVLVATYDVGDTARLTCQLGPSIPPPRITWRVQDPATESVRSLPDKSRTESAQTVLVLPRLVVADSGLYSCTATNILGSIVASMRIIVKERAEQPRRIVRLAVAAPAGLSAALDCAPPSGAAPVVVAVWSRETGDLPKGRHSLLPNSSLHLARLHSSDSGAYLCESALHSGDRITVLTDLQVQRLIPSFNNLPPSREQHQPSPQPPPAYIKLHHISLPYLRHDIEVAFRARLGLGLILYSGTGSPGTDFLSLSLVDWHLVYRFNLGSGSVLLRSRQPVQPGVWTIAGLSRVGRTGRLSVSAAEPSAGDSGDSRPVEKSTPGDRQGLGLPPVFYLGCAPPQLLGRLTAQLGAAGAACLNGDISRLAVSGRPILVGDNAAADTSGIGGQVRQADVCGSGNGNETESGPCQNGGSCRPEHEATGYRCLCLGDYTGRRCERRRERCVPASCGSHGRCREVADGIRCDCGLGLSGERCQSGQPIRVPFFPGNGSASSSYLAVSSRPEPSGNLVALSIRPDRTGSGLLLFSGDLAGSGGDFQSLELRDGRLKAQVRISGRLHRLWSNRVVPPGSWTRLEFRRSLTELSLRLNQSQQARLSLPVNKSRPLIAGNLYLAGLSDDVIAAVGDVIGGQDGGFRGCLRDLELMATKVELADVAVEHKGVADCGQALGCRSGLCEGDCSDRSDGRGPVCDCPDGRSGRYCEHRANPCDRTVCLNAGKCQGLSRERHACQCRLGFTGLHCQIAAALHQSARFLGNGFIELPGSYMSDPAGRSFEFQIEFWLRVENGSVPSLVLWHGQPAGELPDGQDFIAVSVSELGRLRLDCGFSVGSERHLATLESSPASPRIDDGQGRRFRLRALRRKADVQLQLLVDGSRAASAELPLEASCRRRGGVFIGGLPGRSALSASTTRPGSLDALRGCLWGLRMQNSAPVNFMAESLSGLGAVPC